MTFLKLNFELKRKLFHVSAALIPVLYASLPDQINTLILISVATAVWFFDALRIVLKKFNSEVGKVFGTVMRSSESNNLSGLSYMMLGFAFTALAFPTYICIASWLVVIFADAAAALVGNASNKGKSTEKTFAGLFAFITTALIINISYLEFFGYQYHFSSLILASFASALAEFYNRQIKINDNFSIPVVFASVFQLLEFICS